MHIRQLTILPINAALLAIGLVDLITTLVWLRAGCAMEVNPIMASVLKLGLPPFIAVKIGTLVSYVAVMEWYRRRRSELFARMVGLVTVAAYSGIYAVSFCCVNHNFLFG